MRELWQQFLELWPPGSGRTAILVVVVILGSWFGKRLLLALPIWRRLHPQHALILRRVVGIVAVLFAVIASLHLLGVGLGVLLGTAGVLTVAIGFAAQTSMSNLISGIFLMAEEPFRVGDVIRIGSNSGEVVSIELLSVRIRTFDNLLVRLANEDVLKSVVTNLTHYPVRRIDFSLQVARGPDVDRMTTVLRGVADKIEGVLVEPAPVIMVRGYNGGVLDVQFSVWAPTANFATVRTAAAIILDRELRAANIELAGTVSKVLFTADDAGLPVQVLPETSQSETLPS